MVKRVGAQLLILLESAGRGVFVGSVLSLMQKDGQRTEYGGPQSQALLWPDNNIPPWGVLFPIGGFETKMTMVDLNGFYGTIGARLGKARDLGQGKGPG